ncbi:hypothetical protein L209DRAFT_185886 [Thermothelomyces heterothallicus CBS 203.75]
MEDDQYVGVYDLDHDEYQDGDDYYEPTSEPEFDPDVELHALGYSDVITDLRNTLSPWKDLGHGICQIGQKNQATWVREREFSARPTWQQLLDFAREMYNFLASNRDTSGICHTNSGSCVVATLCFHADDNCWTVFQSTIPRGGWRSQIESTGRVSAPQWYEAAHPNPAEGTANKSYHAGDSVEYIASIAGIAGSAAHKCSIAIREPVQVIAAVSIQDAAIAPAPGVAGSGPASYNIATIPG